MTRNPLRCDGTELPVNLLLMAKLAAVCVLLSDAVRRMPEPFLPFLPPLDAFAGSAAFAAVLQVLLVSSGLALLFNWRVRASALVMGAVLMIAVVSSKAYYGNNKLFTGSLLFLTGLYHPRVGPWLIRAQVVILYFGAGLNKLLDPDWHSGQFFHHWAGTRLEQPFYLWVSSLFPPLLLAKAVCWGVIATELALAAAFCVRRAWPWAIWVSVLFHAGLLEFTGTTFTMFFYAAQASMLAFVTWPRRLLMIYDGDCGICNRIRRWMERIDFERAWAWTSQQTGIGDRYGIARAELDKRIYAVVDEGRIYAGFRAAKMALLYNPAFLLAVAVALAAPWGPWTAWYRRILVAVLLAFFFPAFNGAGERVYDWVARNRHRFSGEGSCAVEPQARATSTRR